ncbi:MAG: iron-containing alcohol dehydrogenase [Clostridia bacterium]|nr:iron-containing alcohol dehydrogenase [Clostridia bacterium]
MKNFVLYNPVRVIFGNGESANIGQYVKGFGKKALIVSYEAHDFLAPLLERVIASLKAHGIEAVPFYRVQANPLLCHIREAVEICRARSIDFCIAVGGGSVMDSTKAIAAGVLYPDDLWKMFVSRHDCEVAVPPTDSIPTVMIPTLPATSSEMNCIAVATNDVTTEKAYISAPALYPKLSIMDPALTCSLPNFQTVIGAVDAMSHVLEAYLNGDQHSPLQDRLHEGLLVTIMDELRAILKDPKDVSHRANMQWAASLAWNGYLQSGLNATTPMHQMGHVLSALYNTPHGVTLAIFLDSYFRYTATLNEEREARFALLGEKVFSLARRGKTNRELAEETVSCFVRFMDEVGVPHTLSAAHIPPEDIEKIADEIVAHGCDAEGMLPSIPKIGRDGILTVLEMAK